jgi:hypothetical protein
MPAFDYVSLWAKSKTFIDKAVEARDGGDDGEYHLWASVALEVLGKATLSRVHPTLVADPSHFESVLAAVGMPSGVPVKSITAVTLYERLQRVVDAFDDRMKRHATLLANRRNAELHSGENPIEGLDADAWAPEFWAICEVLLEHQRRSLADWLGDDEAVRIARVIADRTQLLRQTVLARIQRRREDLDRRYPPNSAEREDATRRADGRSVPARILRGADAVSEHACPSCGMKGWLSGSFEFEEITGSTGEPGEPSWDLVELTYDTETFRCSECGLVLDGRDELSVAQLPDSFVIEEEREPDYEPDYGND